MSQSNAAREPSMEEILASIRKIIETTDGSEDGLHDLDTPDDTDEDAEEESPTLARVRDEVANSQTTRTTAEREPSSGSGGPPAQAADRSPSTRPGLSPRYGENARYAPSASATSADSDSKSHVSLAEVAARANTPSSTAREKPEAHAVSPPPAERPSYTTSHPPQPTQDRSKAERTEPEKAPDKMTLGDAMRANALVSAETGNRVAASFEHLNHAVVTGPTRSFDDIAQEMLRPMLQEWLDNNLPVLVERLVREEIERIAKGR